jgi:ketosteroid isomerase-like protein
MPEPSADEQFVDAHVDALARRDLDDAMQHYDDDSVLVAGDERNVGRAQIRRHLEALLARTPADAVVERATTTDAAGRVVFEWRLLDPRFGVVQGEGYDRFALEGGVIRHQEVFDEPVHD